MQKKPLDPEQEDEIEEDENLDSEEEVQEQDIQEEEPLYLTEEQKQQFKEEQEEELLARKKAIYDRIEKQLNEEEATDELTAFIKSDPKLEDVVRGFCGLILGFHRYPDIDKVVLIMKRSGENVHVECKALDKNGKDILFDPKTGNTVKVE